MKTIVAIFIFLFSVLSIAQKSIEDYSFIIVPNQFNFVEGKDTYRLNSITRFLLKKQGLTAYYNEEAPNFKKCDALYADVKKLKGFLKTKLVLTISDCNGVEVYRSKEGSSKQKEYSKAYQDALRKVFVCVEKDQLQLSKGGVVSNDEIVVSKTITEKPEVVDKGATIKTVKEETHKNVSNTIKLPDAKFSNYSKESKNYLLKKARIGYVLYVEDVKTEALNLIGTIELVDGENFYMTTSSGDVLKGYFNGEQDIILKTTPKEEVFLKTD